MLQMENLRTSKSKSHQKEEEASVVSGCIGNKVLMRFGWLLLFLPHPAPIELGSVTQATTRGNYLLSLLFTHKKLSRLIV